MRAYVAPIPSTLSRGIHRVADALTKYAPEGVTILQDHGTQDAIIVEDMDLLVCHVIGPEGWAPYLDYIRTYKKRYAVFQYCLRTSSWPMTHQWTDFWAGAAVVASYYPLAQMCIQDGIALPGVNFLHTPLGVDTDVFRPDRDPPADSGLLPGEKFLVGTSGYVDGMEIIGEWAWVAAANGGRHFHLGPHLRLPNAAVKYRLGIDDGHLAQYWAHCRYVSGLRRGEGFELPAFEGLACGARPVMFDREDARQWLGSHAEYIGEGDDASIRWQLDNLVRGKYRAVTPDEVQWVKETFSWRAMADRFWEAIPR